MEKLPDISTEIVNVIGHFVPLARSIHPDVSEAFILDKAIALAGEWLAIENRKAADRFALLYEADQKRS